MKLSFISILFATNILVNFAKSTKKSTHNEEPITEPYQEDYDQYDDLGWFYAKRKANSTNFWTNAAFDGLAVAPMMEGNHLVERPENFEALHLIDDNFYGYENDVERHQVGSRRMVEQDQPRVLEYR